jgi:hypothetical protein
MLLQKFENTCVRTAGFPRERGERFTSLLRRLDPLTERIALSKLIGL